MMRMCFKQRMIAILLTVIAFSPIIAQRIYGSISFFNLQGDQYYFCYPYFVRLGYYLRHGIISAADFVTSNGSSAFFTRANAPMMYLPIMFFSVLGNLFGHPLWFFVLFYMFQIYIGLFYAQRVATEIYKLDFETGILLACSCSSVFFCSVWYTSWCVICTLVFPLLFYGLRYITAPSLSMALTYLLVLILAFLSGYVAVSFFLVCVEYLYILCSMAKRRNYKIILMVTGYHIIAGLICILHYLYIAMCIKSTISGSAISIWDAFFYEFDVRDYLKMVFNSYKCVVTNINEYIHPYYIGTVWTVILFIIFFHRSRIKNRHKIISTKNADLCFTFFINVVLLLATFADDSPFAYWFYAFVPIGGQMHLPVRYMLITFPILFLGLCRIFEEIQFENKEIFKILAIVCFSILGILPIFSKETEAFLPFDIERLILELLFTAIVFLVAYRFGLQSNRTVISWSIMLFLIASLQLYDFINLSSSETSISALHLETSYNMQLFSDYVSENFDDKKYLRYTCLDDEVLSSVPYFTHDYPWLSSGKKMINYDTYDMRIASDMEYYKMIPYNIADWQYIMDTRADFLLLSQEYIDRYMDDLSPMVNWEDSPLVLDSGSSMYRLCKLYKFVPAYIAGQPFIRDDGTSFDNGFFYSPQLMQTNLVDFQTDEGTYVTITVDAPENSDLVFLEYANSRFDYYLDERHIKPKIVNGEAFFHIGKGIHTVRVEYNHTLEFAGNSVICTAYVFLIGVIIILKAAYAKTEKSNS